MNDYVKQTYEKHDGDLFAIKEQLYADCIAGVSEALEIVEKQMNSIFCLPFTDGAQHINLQYNENN